MGNWNTTGEKIDFIFNENTVDFYMVCITYLYLNLYL